MNMRLLKMMLLLLITAALVLSANAFAEEYQTLQLGDSGEAVLALKQRMGELGYFNLRSKLTDKYNETMVERVKLLELHNGFTPTGVATPELQTAAFSENARGMAHAAIINDTTLSEYGLGKLPEDYPTALDEAGYLADADAAPYIYQSRDEGVWVYLSHDLSVQIRRWTDKLTPLVWFESDVRMRGSEKLETLMDMKATSSKVVVKDPRQITQDYNVVFAVSDDFYGYRKKAGYNNAGIIIRRGEVYSKKTKKSGTVTLPNLDVIAMFDDGRMKTFDSNAHTAQEYLDMGVTDTWAFGPILLSEGEINPVLYTAKVYQNLEPRCAMGMVTPGHYVFMSVKGRLTESGGATPLWLAQRMQALGCTEALNLDGGNSVALIFMDDMLNKPEDTKNKSFMKGVRALSSLIGVGTKPEGWTE